MVTLQAIPASRFKQLGLTKEAGIRKILEAGQNHKRMTEEEVMRLLKLIVREEKRAVKQKLKDINAKQVSLSSLQSEKTLCKTIKRVATRISKDGFRPRLMAIDKEDYVLKVTPTTTSDVINQVRNELFSIVNRVVCSRVQRKAFIDEVKNITGELYDSNIIKEYELLYTDELKLHYKILGFVYDFGSFIINKFTVEPTAYLDNAGNPLNCLLACIRDQLSTDFLGIRRLNKLLSLNKDMTIADIPEIANELNIYIKVLDCELQTWMEVDERFLRDKKDRKNNVYIVLKNNHARNLKDEYKKYQEIEVIKPLHAIYPLKEDKNYKVQEGVFVFDNILKLYINNKETYIEDLTLDINVFYSIVDKLNMMALYEYLVERNIQPNVINLSGDNSVFIMKTKNIEIQLRHVCRHDLLHLVPYTENYTISSSSMYLFRRFIKNSIARLVDPMIAKIFKGFCSPLIYMQNIVLQNKHIYIFDINKAYLSQSNNLWTFIDPPVIISCNRYSNPGIYMKDTYEWYLVLDEDDYTSSIFAILFTGSPISTIYDFGNHIMNELPHCGKLVFNSLIGKFQPKRIHCTDRILITGDEDLSKFLFNDNKRIIDIRQFKYGYCIDFVYDHNFVYKPSLEYISAQIITRCKRKILGTIEQFKKLNGMIIGSMTDSIIVAFDKPIEPNALLDIGTNVGQWKLAFYGHHIISKGPGNYRISHDNGDEYSRGHIDGYEHHIVQRKNNPTINISMNIPSGYILYIGEAGIGKSRFIMTELFCKTYIRLAPTGVAANVIKTTTIHSYFGLIKKSNKVEYKEFIDVINNMPISRKREIQLATHFIIDEIYFVNEHLMHTIDHILRVLCNKCLDYFGGKTIIILGDDAQLTAVNASPFVGSAFYNTLNFKKEILPYCSTTARLKPEYREYCNQFRTVLDNTEIINKLRRLCKIEKFNGLHVCYTNREVYEINRIKITNFNGIVYDCNDYTGIQLKQNCPLMIRSNIDIKDGLYNGRLCTLDKYENERLTLRLIERDPISGNNITRIRTIRTTNIKIAVAFAITIHKCQGLTLDNITIHMPNIETVDNVLLTKLTYVALTRVHDFNEVDVII